MGIANTNQPQVAAIREALVNMLMHTDYFSQMKPRIRVFTDRIEFFNPGALPKDLKTIMREDISLPRNPILTKMFRIIKLAENAGYGFDKMIKGWTKYYKHAPETVNGFDYFKITFYLEQTSTQAELGDKLGDKLGKTEGKILNEILPNNQISITQMADKLNISTTTIENNLNKLKEKGIINRKGSAKGGYWEINTKKLGDSLGEKLGDVLIEKHFNLSKNEQLILQLVEENNTISITQISEKMEISTTATENNIKKLKNKGLLKREGSAKTGKWKIIDRTIN